MNILFALVSLFLITCINSKDPLTAQIMHEMHRPSSYALSPDKQYVAFADKQWSSTTGKSTTVLKYFKIDKPSNIMQLTFPIDGVSDAMPTFSPDYPNHVFFIRKGNIYYKEFPPSFNKTDAIQLTKYPISINDYKIKSNVIVFSAKLYFNCTEGNILQCSKNYTLIRNTQNYAVYNNLKMFDWDTWEDEDKGNHIFVHKFKLNEDNTLSLIGSYPKDLTKNMKINAPPLDCGNEMYDISNDGKMVAFTGHYKGENEAFTTTWRTFVVKNIDSDTINTYDISSSVKGRSANPRFSKDNTKIAFLGMKRPFLEADLLELYTYNILTNEIIYYPIDQVDTSIDDLYWYTDNELIFESIFNQYHTLFSINIADPKNPKYFKFPLEGDVPSYAQIVSVVHDSIGNNFLLVTKVGYDMPETLIKMDLQTHQETVLLDLNANIKTNHELVTPEEIHFVGGDNETVHGFVFKPINFQQGKKYPTVLLIHGGPESAWVSDWSFRWNPQLFVNHGFAVVLINPHGSVGFGVKFLDRVRNNWGGTPYDDFMKGMEYAEKMFDFIDVDKECAAGGSYGGYSVNWIQGHTKKFKCLINHDGVFSLTQMHYSSDDLYFLKAEACPPDNMQCNPFDSKEIREGFEKWNPERYVDNWATPMLVIHGGNDYRVPMTEALSTFTALQLKKVPSRFILMTQENHWTLKPENSIRWYDEVLGWCDKYINLD